MISKILAAIRQLTQKLFRKWLFQTHYRISSPKYATQITRIKEVLCNIWNRFGQLSISSSGTIELKNYIINKIYVSKQHEILKAKKCMQKKQ